MQPTRWAVAVVALVALVALVSSAAGATQERVTVSGYLPPMERADGPQTVSYILCPEPWIEMVDDGTGDGAYDEAWHCAPAEYTCAHPTGERAGYGCGLVAPGWHLPAPAPVGGFRDEIMEHVMRPCYLEMARAHAVPGFSDQELTDLVMMVNPQVGDELIESVTVMLNASPQQDWASRKLVYDLSLRTCINAARAAQ